ncbi:hypothetical protein K1719_009734 [Acacia pycnantha]|nr:hypothetical protein K1719_009734 [Acacia pycnantha]
MKQTAKASGIEGRIVNLSSIAHTYTYEEDFLKLFTFYIWKNVPQVRNPLLLKIQLKALGAATCYVALHNPRVKGVSGKYFLDCNEFEPDALATDELLGRKLSAILATS